MSFRWVGSALALAWLSSGPLAAAERPQAIGLTGSQRVQVEVELVEAGVASETRVLDLDLSGSREATGGAWLAWTAALGVMPGLFWLLRRLPRLTDGLR